MATQYKRPTLSEKRTMTKPILLWGATGFTGQLVARELAQAKQSGERLILAGRNQQRLDEVAQSLDGIDVERRVAEALDKESLIKLLEGVGVVATTVGPYRRYGWALAELCAERGIDYVDLCGETPFIRRTIDELHTTAQRSGARLVHACGFDSIPSDLGALLLATELQRHGHQIASIQTTVRRLRGGLSGGTLASMLGLVQDAVRDKSLRRILGHPYSLNPEGQRSGADGSDRTDARFDPDHDRWTAPFIMASINSRVVRRSAAVLGYSSEHFRYDEAMACPTKGRAKTTARSLKAFTVLAALAPTRWLIKRFLPKPGQGPNQEQRERGCFELHLVGRVVGNPAAVGRVIVAAQGDPGYSQTAVMLAQSARLLAEHKVEVTGGIHTPATALGMLGIQRLREHRFRFDYEPI